MALAGEKVVGTGGQIPQSEFAKKDLISRQIQGYLNFSILNLTQSFE